MIGIRKAGSSLSQINPGTGGCFTPHLGYFYCSDSAHILRIPSPNTAKTFRKMPENK